MKRLAFVVLLTCGAALAIGIGVWRWNLPQTAPATAQTDAGGGSESRGPGGPDAGPSDARADPPPVARPAVLQLETGRIEAQLALDVDEAGRPLTPVALIAEDAPGLHVTLAADLQRGVPVRIEWRTRAAIDGMPGPPVRSTQASVLPGSTRVVRWDAPAGGFPPGDHDVSITAEGAAPAILPIRVEPVAPHADLLVSGAPLPGANIALAALGGHVVRASAPLPDPRWNPAHLIDGFPFLLDGDICRPCGWSAKAEEAPHEIVFAFDRNQETVVEGVTIDPSTFYTAVNHSERMPRHVEVWLAARDEEAAYVMAARARVARQPIEQLIRVQPARARFVKLRILNNHGGATTELGEVGILSADPAALAGLERNLALPSLGGVLLRYSDRGYSRTGADYMFDGRTDTGWRSNQRELPQDFVFAFTNDLPALVDRVELALSGVRPEERPTRVLVSTSSDSYFVFDDVGELTIGETEEVATLAVGREARYLRVRILENKGRQTGISELRILEGSRQDYQPVLLRAAGAPLGSESGSAAANATPPAAATAVEEEPNDDPARASALALGTIVAGVIDPLDDRDHFAFQLPDGPRQVLTVEMTGEPYLRTALSLLDGSGAETHQFDPGKATSSTARFSWLVGGGGGRRLLRVSQPPASIVLVWDTSGSMAGRWKGLEEAVMGYLSQVRPTELLNMIRFSHDVEVLLPEFTSDPERLRAAAAGKFRPMLSTALFDALAKGFQLLEGRSGNRAVILMSDGADSTSRLKLPGMWSLLERPPARVFTIGLGPAMHGYEPEMGTTGARFLVHVARATGGRAFSTRTAPELGGLYERIASEVRATTRYTLRVTASAATGNLRVESVGERIPAVSAPARVALVLDASGSMRRRLGTRRMMDIAKDVLADLVRTLPDDIRVGLRVYGHRVREGRPGDCKDSQPVVPFGPLDRSRLLGQLARIDALGTTPLAYSLAEVGRDLARERGETMVVVVTDGREECGGSVEEAVAALQAGGHQVRLNIVGFALTDKPAQAQMQAAAASTGGRYLDARDAETLSAALQDALRAPFRVLDQAEAVVADGQVGGMPVALPEGTFDVVVDVAGEPLRVPVRIETNRETRIELRRHGQQIAVQVHQP